MCPGKCPTRRHLHFFFSLISCQAVLSAIVFFHRTPRTGPSSRSCLALSHQTSVFPVPRLGVDWYLILVSIGLISNRIFVSHVSGNKSMVSFSLSQFVSTAIRISCHMSPETICLKSSRTFSAHVCEHNFVVLLSPLVLQVIGSIRLASPSGLSTASFSYHTFKFE